MIFESVIFSVVVVIDGLVDVVGDVVDALSEVALLAVIACDDFVDFMMGGRAETQSPVMTQMITCKMNLDCMLMALFS